MKAGLGWDVVEWCPGDFARRGLVLFTLRNVLRPGKRGARDGYAEKAMVVRLNQQTPLHAHHRKMEDIINRGGGELVIELHIGPDDRDSRYVLVNGVRKPISHKGATVILSPGESITLVPGVFHAFHAARGDVIAGEVSTHNADDVDNDFLDPVARFPDLEEDVPPERLVVGDYSQVMSEWGIR
jgi:D-lyxose ketol-isomerase